MRRDDLRPRVDELDAVDRLAPDWLHLLLQLREAPQPNQRATTGDAGGNQVQSIELGLAPTAAAETAQRTARAKSKQRFRAPAQTCALPAL